MVVVRNLIVALAVCLCLVALCEKDDVDASKNLPTDTKSVDLYVKPTDPDGYNHFDVYIEGLTENEPITGQGWIGSILVHRENGIEVEVSSEGPDGVRVSLQVDGEEVAFGYSENASYGPVVVSYNW